MLRIATLLLLTPLLVVGCNTPPASAQERPQERVRQAEIEQTSAGALESAEFPSAQDTDRAATPRALPLGKEIRYLEFQRDARKCEDAEQAADAILEITGPSVQTTTQESRQSQEIPEEARQKLVHELGHAFIIFREPVQAELKLTGEQKAKLDQQLRQQLPDAMRFFQQVDGLKHEEEDKARADYLPKALARLEPALKEILTESQRTRLQQMVMQREGLFGGGETLDILHVTQEQRMQFMAVVQQTQQKIQPLLEEAQKGGNPAEFQHKVLKMRSDLEASLEALLTEAQKKQWKEMLGKPVDQKILFQLSSH
jgi:hypothetical protein